MDGLPIFDTIVAWFRRRELRKRLRDAQAWPVARGEVNHWEIVTADKEVHSFATPQQVEAGFHFIVGGEYFGGYFRSVALSRKDALNSAKGSPIVHVRYNPANPDSVVVLAEDNSDNLPFRVFSGPQDS